MAGEDADSFADLLRRYRVAAGLSQEVLAERAGLSARAISDLERGIRRAPYRDTVRLLADALGLDAGDRAGLEASVRRTRTPAQSDDQADVHRAPASHTPHNLPASLTSFVGRAEEVATVRRLVREYRLVTLTGPGGIGKTRLALEAARAALDHFRDGVRFVELAALAEPALVPLAVAAALGVREESGRPVLESLIDHLRDAELLLVLDNCEHLLDAAAALADTILSAAPNVRVLATSRQAFGMVGEAIYRVPPLLLPEAATAVGAGDGLTTLSSVEAVRLFLERATPVALDFTLTERNAAAVAQICGLLDGIPLAIELAAARVKVLTPEQIAARLDDRFALLTGGSRTALPRQQTLRALIDWSYDLLTAHEQRLLARLAVFRGGCTLEAVEAVDDSTTIDTLTALVDKSLVLVARQDEEARYRLLETVREYAASRLEATDRGDAERRHLQWCFAFAQRTDAELRGPGQRVALDRFEREHDNIRAALERARDNPELASVGLQLAAATRHFWMIRGYPGEGRVWLETLLAVAGDAPAELRAQGLDGAAALAQSQGDTAAARALQQQALALWRTLENPVGLGVSLNTLGIMLKSAGDLSGAAAVFEEALGHLRAGGHRWAQSTVLNNLAAVAADLGEYERVVSYSEASIALKRELGDAMGVAVSLFNLADAARKLGEYDRSAALLDEAAALFRQAGNTAGLAQTLHSLGLARIRRGDRQGAGAALREGLALYREIDNTPGVTLCLEGLADLAAAGGDWQRAARLLGAADATRQALNAPLAPSDREELDRTLAQVRAAIPAATFEAAWAAGRALPPDVAVALALDQPIPA